MNCAFPLTSISGALGLINGGALGEMPVQARQMLDIAYKNSQRLSLLINDLLDMDKLISGNMPFNLQPLSLKDQLEQALESNQAYGRQHQVSFKLGSQANDLTVIADELRLQQVLSNFMSNAAKFSKPGGQVEVEMLQKDNMARVEVIDQGDGIKTEFYARIFEKFSQADSSDTKQRGGTGLGLAISKEIIERMQGKIGFVSEVGLGSCFYFELPIPADK